MAMTTSLLKDWERKEKDGLCSLEGCEELARYRSKVSGALYCEKEYQRFLAKKYNTNMFDKLESCPDWKDWEETDGD